MEPSFRICVGEITRCSDTVHLYTFVVCHTRPRLSQPVQESPQEPHGDCFRHCQHVPHKWVVDWRCTILCSCGCHQAR